MKTTYSVLALVWFGVNATAAQVAVTNATWRYVNAATNLAVGSNVFAPALAPDDAREPAMTEPPTVYVTNGPAASDLGVRATRMAPQEIRLLDDAAVADYGLIKVLFPAEITEAPLTILTPDGRKLACRATLLALHDRASGQTLMLGEVQKSIGELSDGNTVVYPDAFDTISAGIRYRYTPYSLEQDILLYGQIELPKEFQPEYVQLEVWSEWIDSTPDSKVSQTIDLRPLAATGAQTGAAATDDTLQFGAMRIADGYAFGIQSEDEKTPVAKTFVRIEGRDWLIESVDYLALKPKLDKLPKSQASLSPDKLKSDRRQLVRSLLARTDSKSPGRPRRMAKASAPAKDSVVLDFVIVSGVPVPAGAVSWWPGGGNAVDAIGTNAGILQGNVGYAAGKVGQGFNLDGNQDGVSVGNPINLRLQDFTIETWIRRASSSIVSYGSYGIGVIWGYGYLGYGLYLDSAGTLGLTKIGISGVQSSAAVTNTSFHHVAVTKSGSTVVFYLDGVAYPVGAYNPGFSFSTSAAIGFRADNLDNSFYGAIDEPTIYNRALSTSEVQSSYNAGAAGKVNPNCVTPPADLAGWWPGDGNAYDFARTNFGALVGNTTYVPAVAGQGFSFDGTGDGVTITNNAALNVGAGENFTIEAWIQPLTNSTTYGVTSIVDKRVAPNTSQCLGYVFCLVNGVMNLRISDSISGNGANFADTQDLRIGSGYHHIAVTVNRGSTNGGHFYVDGVQRPVVFNPTVVSGSLSNAGAFLIGIHAQTGFNGGHKGVIDEVSFYRRELTNSEIAALYSAGSAGKCKIDTDGDGLTDLQEAFLGTNPSNSDTDGDGLTDGDEVFVYHTNPKNPDTDGDGMPDGWEWNNFATFTRDGTADYDSDGLTDLQEYQLGTSPCSGDTDGDGLSDSEELVIPVDADNLALGYLNPLNPDTGNTGVNDGQKDADKDALSNLGELRTYNSFPETAHSFNTTVPGAAPDGEYFMTANSMEGAAATLAHLHETRKDDFYHQIDISQAPPNAIYDLYFVNSILAQRWEYRRVYDNILCNATGEATLTIKQPDPVQGYFIILDARDDDGDGLSNGYETWFKYFNGQQTVVDFPDSDDDVMTDGWEVAYGLDPTLNTGDNGISGNPDGDDYVNASRTPIQTEFSNNQLFNASSFDPLKPHGSSVAGQQARPVVSISSVNPEAYKLGGTATFKIRRTVGSGANMNQALTVYYSVGGDATYPTDYTLSPGPLALEYPRVFSAEIPATLADVTVTVRPELGGIKQAGSQTVVVKLSPYGTAADPQVVDPKEWKYVVDLFHEAVTLKISDGILINLDKTVPEGYLRIKPVNDTAPLPFINVANSARGTVARIYTGANVLTDPSKIVGEYFSAPEGKGRNPSRTTVDRYGNVWVGNRAQGDLSVDGGQDDGNGGSIAQFGIIVGGTRCNSDGSPNAYGDYLKPPFIYNTCIDRNRDGFIRTVRGANPQLAWPNADDADSLGGVSHAVDEAILRYLRVFPTGVRTIVVDPNNDLWVGGFYGDNAQWHEFIDGNTAMLVTGRRLNFRAGGYGGVVDGSGAVWSSGYSSGGGLVRFLPGNTMPVLTGGVISGTTANYGITVDPSSGDVWQAVYSISSGNVVQFRADHCFANFPTYHVKNRGIVVDGHQNVWVGGTGGTIFHLTTSGVSIGSIPMSFPSGQPTISGSAPLGVTVDSSGKVWAICQSAQNIPSGVPANPQAMRIDPSKGAIPLGSDRPLGEVVEVLDMGAEAGPYNYSDMSGFVTLSTAQPSGVWDHVEDAVTDNTLWTTLTMNGVTPTQTRIIVEVRAANNITDLPAWPFQPVVVGGVTPPNATTALPLGVKGRFIEVRANLVRDFDVTASPELHSLTLAHDSAGCAINITTHPKSQEVSPGNSQNPVHFTVTAQFPPSSTPDFRWYKDGTYLNNVGNISGADTATLNIANPQFTDAGRYTVKVGASSCGTFQLESAPARLHVKGNAPTISAGQDLPLTATVAENNPVTLSASASSTLANADDQQASIDISYQWRKNNEPIGSPVSCASGPCSTVTATKTIANAQCSDVGFYSVVFWNKYGQIATRNCELSITRNSVPVPKVTLTVSPTGTVTDENQNILLTANTCMTVSCVQWYVTPTGSNKKIALMANPDLSDPDHPINYKIPTPIICDKLGTYTVSITDNAGSFFEASATVSGTSPIAIIASITLRIIPDDIGSGAWGYQWSYSSDNNNYTDIPGATLDSYTPPQTEGFYRGLATHASGAQGTVSVFYAPSYPYVSANATVKARLSLTYNGNPMLLGPYRWYFQSETGEPEEDTGVTTRQYTINPVDCSKGGVYRLAGACTGSFRGTAELDVASPTVSIPSMTLRMTPDDIGSGPWGYQWSYSPDNNNYTDIPGATLDSYTPPQTEERYYRGIATHASGAQGTVSVYYAPSWPYVSKVAIAAASFDVTYTPQVVGVLGAGSWAYHWYFAPEAGGPLVDKGETVGPYTINTVDCSERGSYRVDVYDACGTSVDSSASGSVYLPDDNCPP